MVRICIRILQILFWMVWICIQMLRISFERFEFCIWILRIFIRMLQIWLECFESLSNVWNLHSNASNPFWMVWIGIRMLRIPFEWFEFAFECFQSIFKVLNLHSNGSNLFRRVRICIRMFRIPFEWFEFALEFFKSIFEWFEFGLLEMHRLHVTYQLYYKACWSLSRPEIICLKILLFLFYFQNSCHYLVSTLTKNLIDSVNAWYNLSGLSLAMVWKKILVSRKHPQLL